MIGGAEAGRSAGATITPDTRWMTYKEMADFLGMKEESARRRAQRDGWPRQLGNDGRTRVGVPGDAVAPAEGSGATDAGDDHPGETAALREALARERERADRAEAIAVTVPDLRERTGRAEGRAEAAEELAKRRGEELAGAQDRAGRAEGESAALREQVTAAREHATTERARAETSARELEAMRAELAQWTSGGPFTRAIRAFLSRRGRP